MILLKKFILIFLSIFSLFISSTYAIENTDNFEVIANDLIRSHINTSENEIEILTEKLNRETNEEVRKELISEIQDIMFLSKANFTIKDCFQSGNKIKLILEASHQKNLSNYIDYNSRLKKAKEYYFQKEDLVPNDLEITCLNETLDLCKNKTTKCNFELELVSENDTIELEPLNFTSMFSIFKSFIF